MDIKKTVTIEGVRSWTGPMENYEAHKECVEHWCGGGDVEGKLGSGTIEFAACGCGVTFSPMNEYRIKRREPQRGEIWTNADGLAYEVMRSDGSMRQLADTTIHAGGVAGERPFERLGLVYKAPSVEAYIAKKLLDKVEQYTEQGFKAHALYEAVEAAAGEE